MSTEPGQDPQIPCTRDLVETQFTIPLESCTGEYTIERPLLLDNWTDITTTVTDTSLSGCSVTTSEVNPDNSVTLTFGGTSTCVASTMKFFWQASDPGDCGASCGQQGGDYVGILARPFNSGDPELEPPGTVDTTGCVTSYCFYAQTSTGAFLIFQTNTPGSGRVVRVSDGASSDDLPPGTGTGCQKLVTVRYEGCPNYPPTTYNDENPPPGGGTPGGSGSPSGNPGSPPSDPNDKPQPPPPPPNTGGGFGGGNTPPPPSSGNSPPPPPSPVSFNFPGVGGQTIFYPSGAILTPSPEPEFPPIIGYIAGEDPIAIPWNGVVVFPGAEAGETVVLGNAYPATYISPMMAQQRFANWKVLKHAHLQFDNRKGLEIFTSRNSNTSGNYGKAVQRMRANIALIYNNRLQDEAITDLYRYDTLNWDDVVYSNHRSPKQLEPYSVFKEPLQGTSYSYQLGVYSFDSFLWTLVGWQVEGKLKGSRTSHGRD